MESSPAPVSRAPRPRASKIGLGYATALCAALPLALLDGGMAALLGDLPIEKPFDLVRFAAFITGAYALLAALLATLEIPFVMLLEADDEEPAGRASKGYAAAFAVAAALAPLEPMAVWLRELFARTSFAALALLLAGVGLALGALLVFAVLERVLARLLRRAEAAGAAGRALASPAAGVLTPVVVIAVWGALVGADILDPGSREAVSLAATALAILAIQGGLAWLVTAGGRSERLARVGIAGVLLSLFGVAALVDGVLRSPSGDRAVDAASHQTLLGSFVLPALRQAVRGEERGPAILPPIKAKRARTAPAARPRPAPTPVAAAPKAPLPPNAVAATKPVAPPTPPPTATPAPKSDGPVRNILLVTFDAFDPAAVAMAEAGALQELAARSLQSPVRAPASVAVALRELFGEGEGALGRWLSRRGYESVGLHAWNAKGRGQFAPEGFQQFRLIGGNERRNAADATIARARAHLRGVPRVPWCLWLHLPGPAARSATALRAAARRAGIRVGWLVKELERSRADDRTVVAVVGLPGRSGGGAVALLAVPGRLGERGRPLSLADFGAHLRAAAGGGK